MAEGNEGPGNGHLILDASLVECTPNVWHALLLKYKTANINVKNFCVYIQV